MKRKGRHPINELTAVKVRSAGPGRYSDGGGLYLFVAPSGAKRWFLRTIVHGRRRDIGLGSAQLVTLAEARETAARLRKSARNGGDPQTDRHRGRQRVPTFAETAKTVIEGRRATWKNEKHAAQWASTFEHYVFPLIGNRRVDTIDTPAVIQVLSPIWHARPETARRVRQRIGVVLDWAKAAGFRQGDNPVAAATNGLARQSSDRAHFAAMPYADLPAFVKKLRTRPNDTVAMAMELLILTAARTGEVIGARWDEIDLDAAVWTVPASRMKMKRTHRVPLSPRSIELLKGLRALGSGNEFVVPGRVRGRPLSNMAMLELLRREKVPVTVHGFRSSFRDWAAETTSFTREACEMALAHTIKNKAEAAYRRGDLLDIRRRLMLEWADYLSDESLNDQDRSQNTSADSAVENIGVE